MAGRVSTILGAPVPKSGRLAGRDEGIRAKTSPPSTPIDGQAKRRSRMSNLKISAQGDREILMTRTLAASRQMVFDAFTKPELVKRWLLGPDGWTMPVCEIDLRVGG